MAGQRSRDNNPVAKFSLHSLARRYSSLYFTFLSLLLLVVLTACIQNKSVDELPQTATAPLPTASPSALPSPSATPSALPPEAEPSVSPLPLNAPALVAAVDLTGLIIPVAGVRPIELRDTYNEARTEGRTHNAIDIMAARGTPVLATANGEIVKLFFSERGGNTIYQMSEDNKYVFYYAHLERYAEDLAQGQYARQRQVIGYVGDTGNAGAGNYHLHFSIWLVTDPKHFWDGENINPYPILRQTLGTILPAPSPRTKNQEEQR